jgi:hypothetical protein
MQYGFFLSNCVCAFAVALHENSWKELVMPLTCGACLGAIIVPQEPKSDKYGRFVLVVAVSTPLLFIVLLVIFAALSRAIVGK